ncbi:uncharacterized protein LOC131878486 [Tigriopus californicus]|uniref:uncharacterized protein LOC131878486 n=1 Tax=Tigriopus californicus TaxID=6832 RepID=UPI0027DA82CA|nr:uncharacterized protein LOC131878486 [Tigriopus californicus]
MAMAPYNFFFDVLDDYLNDRFCDLEICGLMSKSEMRPIRCHKLVICSVIQHWSDFVTDDTDRLHLPDIDHAQLKQFIDAIYQKLTITVHTWDGLDAVIASFLGIFQPSADRKSLPRKRKKAKPDSKCQGWKVSPSHDIDSVSNVKEVKDEPVNIRVKIEVNPDFDIYDDAMDLFDSGHSASEDDFEHNIDEDEGEDYVLGGRRSIKSELSEDDDVIPVSRPRRRKRKSSHEIRRPVKKSKRKSKKVSDDAAAKLSLADQALSVNHNLMQKANSNRSIQPEEVHDLLRSGIVGVLKVDVTSSRVKAFTRPVVLKSLTEMTDCFFALVGVQQHDCEIVGKSLAWTTQSIPDIEKSFSQTIEAFHTVFGLPRAPLTSASCFYTYSGLKKRSFARGLVSDLYRKFMYQCTRTDLENELNHPDTAHAFTTPEPARQEISLPLKEYEVTMKPDLDRFDDLVLVGVYKHGVEVRQIKLPDDDPEFAATICSRLLTLIWVGGSDKRTFPESPEIYEAFKINTRLNYTGKTIKKLLASNEEIPRPLPVVTCEICGKQIQENIFMNNMILHKRYHTIQDFKCECDIQLKSYAQKKRHYEEFHRPANARKRSSNNPSTDGMNMQPHICDICGKVLISFSTLKEHIRRTHANLHCEHCNKDFGSALNFKQHWRKKHPQLELELPPNWFSCDQCDAAYPQKIDYLKHLAMNHGPEDMKPLKCGVCAKGFSDKSKLRYHMLNMHIKSRPYVCRSEGCTAAFNFNGNLYAHERKLHGKDFGKTKPLDVVLPESQLIELGCQLRQMPAAGHNVRE